MDIAEVKIGMFVRGNDRDRYHYTNSDMTLGVIIDVHKNDNAMGVMILRHEEYVNKIYYKYFVHPKFFDIVENSQGEIVDRIVTDEKGEGISKRLPINEEFTVYEEKTKKGYILSNEIPL